MSLVIKFMSYFSDKTAHKLHSRLDFKGFQKTDISVVLYIHVQYTV